MEEITLDDWESFEAQVKKDLEFVRKKKRLKKESNSPFVVFDFLYRGHSNSNWQLDTTLERFTSKNEFSWKNYHLILQAIHTGVTSLSPHIFELDDFEIRRTPVPPGYEMMIYIRHHGFPSPLLDWTKSPYVAAFFAFFEAQGSENVSIYSCLKDQNNFMSVCANDPHIEILGPYVQTHKRHYQQQSWYTICYKEGANEDRFYCNHEEVKGNTGDQILKKYNLPANLRSEVLHKLDLMNINSYSLFGSEESLMSTLAYREIEKE